MLKEMLQKLRNNQNLITAKLTKTVVLKASKDEGLKVTSIRDAL